MVSSVVWNTHSDIPYHTRNRGLSSTYMHNSAFEVWLHWAIRYVITPLHVLRLEGVVLVNRILHKQGCVIRNLIPVEAMFWQLCMCNNDHEHVAQIRRCCTTVTLKADWQANAVRLLQFLWLVLGSADVEKLRQTNA